MFDTVSLDSLRWTGAGLKRPECVMATASGDVYCSDARGGVTCVRAGASQVLYGGNVQPVPRPNGIALRKNGNFLFANIAEDGGVYELSRNGDCTKILARVDGVDLPPTNFVCEDGSGRVWVSVSTWRVPRSRAYRREVADGFVILLDDRGARVVADGIGYSNEIVVSQDGRSLFVNETFGRRLLRFDITADSRLINRRVLCSFGKGTYPDGLTFDVEGAAWITSIISNRVIRVTRDGEQQMILEDADAAHIEWCESAYEAGTMSREHLEKAAGKVLRNISSLAFGGADLKNVYLGCLLGDALATFRSPVPGVEPLHWRY